MPSPAQAFVQKHLRFNFVINMLDGGFFGLGVGFASFVAVIPLFVHHLTDSAILIGLVPAIHNVGWQLPQLLTAGWVSRARHYKPLVLWMTIHERVPYLGLAIVAFFLPKLTNQTVLILTFLLLIWQGFGAGLSANPWTNLVTKVMPAELHGTFFGTQAAAYNVMAGLSAIAAGLILDRISGPLNFSLCFALTFVAMVVSFFFLALTREMESRPKPPGHAAGLWAKSMAILKLDGNFRAFLLVRLISQFAGMSFAFYVIYGVKHFGMSDAAAGVMVSILLIGQIILSPIMGRLGDRRSHRGVMIAGALGAALSAVLAWRATSTAWFYPIFLLEAAAIVAIWTIPLAMSVGFAKDEDDRPLYIGMANTIPAPAAILAPVFGGWLADAVGYDVMFMMSAFFGLMMALVLWLVVKDPAKT